MNKKPHCLRWVWSALLWLIAFTLLPPTTFCSEKKLLLRVGYLPIVSQLPLLVSYQKDQFKYKEVDVALRKLGSYTALEASLRVGALDIAYVPIPIALSMISEGVPLKIVGYVHRGGSYLIGNHEGDITTLKGKRIGVPGLDSNENFRLRDKLNKIHIRYGVDYRTIALPFHTALTELKNKRVDYIFFPEPYVSLIAQENKVFRVAELDTEMAGGSYSVLVINEHKLVKLRRHQIKEWLKSVYEAVIYLGEIPLGGNLEQKDIPDLDKEIVGQILQKQDGGIEFNFFKPDLELLAHFQKSCIEMQMIRKPVVISEKVDLELFDEVIKEMSD